MKVESMKFIMLPGSVYKFEGETHFWAGSSIIVEVRKTNDILRMRHAAKIKIAKYIVTHINRYKKSQWIYINYIQFEKYVELKKLNEKMETKENKKRQKHSPSPIVSYTDLFGQEREIMSNGKTRLKPVYKGE